MKDGQLTIQDRYRFDAALKSFPNGNAILRLERPKRIRSLQQSRYWWGVCVHLVSEHCGYEPEEVHEDLLAKMDRSLLPTVQITAIVAATPARSIR